VFIKTFEGTCKRLAGRQYPIPNETIFHLNACNVVIGDGLLWLTGSIPPDNIVFV
jgi:hypothetical protein